MFKNMIPWKKNYDIKIRRPGTPVYGLGDDSYHALNEFRQEMDRIWNRFWDDWSDAANNREFERGMDFEDKGDEYVLYAELAGFSPDDIDINIRGNTMTIRAEHKSESDGKNGSTHHYGKFVESFTLPAGLDKEGFDARFSNGLLEVHLPKNEVCRPRRIAVHAS